ncbi:MAG: AAA family ATPase, partial [Pseudomonadota bacterium]
MLVFLSIRSFVLIDRLDLEASEAFTALTGETGAGKSIILDALGLVLGVQANKALVRKGQDEASVTAMFDLPETHPAWAILTEHGLTADPDETLILTRRLSRTARARAFINGQPVAASVLSAVGETLVEIHGQHAASGLMRPASHLALLDAFGDHAALTLDCQQTWNAYEAARAHRRGLSEALKSLRERREWLTFAVEDLEKLAPEEGECEHLTARRTALLQSERLGEAMADARSALAVRTVDDALSKAARALERILRTQGLSALDEGLPNRIQAAADAVERTLIEYTEARSCVEALNL